MRLVNNACVLVEQSFPTSSTGLELPALPGQACNQDGVKCVGGSQCNNATGTCECDANRMAVNGQCMATDEASRLMVASVVGSNGDQI